MYCRKCGKEIPDDSAFCPACGFITAPAAGAVQREETAVPEEKAPEIRYYPKYTSILGFVFSIIILTAILFFIRNISVLGAVFYLIYALIALFANIIGCIVSEKWVLSRIGLYLSSGAAAGGVVLLAIALATGV